MDNELKQLDKCSKSEEMFTYDRLKIKTISKDNDKKNILKKKVTFTSTFSSSTPIAFPSTLPTYINPTNDFNLPKNELI